MVETGWRSGGGVEGWRGGNNRGLVTQSLLGSGRRERLRPIQNAALAPWRRPGCHTHTHTSPNTQTHTQPVHPNSCLVDPACQARRVGIFISRKNSLSSLLLSCMPEGRERERERESTDRQADRQTDNIVHLRGCCVLTGCCCKM